MHTTQSLKFRLSISFYSINYSCQKLFCEKSQLTGKASARQQSTCIASSTSSIGCVCQELSISERTQIHAKINFENIVHKIILNLNLCPRKITFNTQFSKKFEFPSLLPQKKNFHNYKTFSLPRCAYITNGILSENSSCKITVFKIFLICVQKFLSIF